MVSKARLDFPEPESPVTTTSLSRGISSETFFRLCTRAPCTAMLVRGAGRLRAVCLPVIRRLGGVEKRQLLHVDVALFGQADGQRRFADQPLVGQVLACAGDAVDAERSLEVMVDFGGGPGFADLLQVV